jgi:hypothetical protein
MRMAHFLQDLGGAHWAAAGSGGACRREPHLRVVLPVPSGRSLQQLPNPAHAHNSLDFNSI